MDHTVPDTPTVEAYAAALRRLESELKESWRRMLLAHSSAPSYTMSASKLAEVAGYKSHHAANLQYGRFGAILASELQYRPGQASSSFASFSKNGKDDWQWHLHGNFAQALKLIGWVRTHAA